MTFSQADKLTVSDNKIIIEQFISITKNIKLNQLVDLFFVC